MALQVVNHTENVGTEADHEKRYKMVVIGETGSGKTNFVELLLNYAKQFQNASDFDFSELAKLTKENSECSVKDYESDTIESVRYRTNFGNFYLDIIDTPGFGDTRGEDQRKANIEDILCAVKKEHYLNCICVVINGTSARLTDYTEKVMKGMVSILPETALQNMIIVFTNTQDEFSLTFDTEILRKYDLYVPPQHTFLFDNPYARYKKAKTHPPKLMEKLKSEFEVTFQCLKGMIEIIQKMEDSPTLNFGDFKNIVENIEATITELALLHQNKENLKNQIQNIVDYLEKHEKIVDQIHAKYTRTDIVFTKSKHVICNSPKCYSNCHENCKCWFTMFSVRACKIIQEEFCRHCGHSYKEHSKNKFLFTSAETDIPLPTDFQELATRVKNKKQILKELPAMEGFNQAIDTKTELLELQLKKFQSMASIAIFSTNATEYVKDLKNKIEIIPDYIHKEKIVAIINTIIRVFNNPFTAEDSEVKYHWAVGILEANPDHLTEKEISRLFREQSRKYHHDKPDYEELSAIFKRMNHAKEYLIGKLRNMISH